MNPVGTGSYLCHFVAIDKLRSSLVVRASESRYRGRNCPGFDPSILRHNEIWGAADEAMLNIVHKKNPKNSPLILEKRKEKGTKKEIANHIFFFFKMNSESFFWNFFWFLTNEWGSGAGSWEANKLRIRRIRFQTTVLYCRLVLRQNVASHNVYVTKCNCY